MAAANEVGDMGWGIRGDGVVGRGGGQKIAAAANHDLFAFVFFLYTKKKNIYIKEVDC